MPRVRLDRIEGFALLGLGALLLALGVALRARHAFDVPLWLDEAYSAFASDRGLRFLWTVTPRYEVHPPFYYTLLAFWDDLFGRTLVVRRMLGLLLAVAALPVVAVAGDALGILAGWARPRRRWLALVAFGLACVHPLAIEMADQVRPYPMMILAYAVATLAVLRLGIGAAAGRRLSRGWLATAIVAEIAMLWLHALGPLYGAAVAIALALLTIRRGMARADVVALAITQLVTLLVYLPALAITLGQAGTWANTTWLRFQPAALSDGLATIYANRRHGVRWAVLAFAILGCAAVAWRPRPGARAAAALLVLALAPTLASVVLSMVAAPVFLVRTLSAATVPALLLVAAGLAWPGRAYWVAAPLAVWLMTMDVRVARKFAARPPMQDWYGTIRWLQPRIRPGDVVWAYPNEGALPLDYALGDMRVAMAVRPIPAPVPAFGVGGYYPTGSRGVVSLYPAEIAALTRTPAAVAPPTIWLLRLGYWRYDPGDRMLEALAARRVVVDHYRSNQIDLIGLRRAP